MPVNDGMEAYEGTELFKKIRRSIKLTDRERGSLLDSLKSATRILVGSARAPAPIAESTFKPLRTQAARSAT